MGTFEQVVMVLIALALPIGFGIAALVQWVKEERYMRGWDKDAKRHTRDWKRGYNDPTRDPDGPNEGSFPTAKGLWD